MQLFLSDLTTLVQCGIHMYSTAVAVAVCVTNAVVLLYDPCTHELFHDTFAPFSPLLQSFTLLHLSPSR